jgi:hypothetical protein
MWCALWARSVHVTQEDKEGEFMELGDFMR